MTPAVAIRCIHPDRSAALRVRRLTQGLGAALICTALLSDASMLVGCAKVEPGPDYQRAADLVAERVGAPAIYNPDDEAAVAARINELLADGLSIDEAVRAALLNNREFQARFLDIGASRADVVQSALFTNPSFSFSGQFPDGGGRAKLNMGLGQQIADLWQIPVRKKVAEAQLEATLLSIAQLAVDLAADVKGKCYRVLALRQAESVTRDHLALAEHSVKLVEAQLQAGEVTLFEVNLARANAVDVRLALVALERERQIAEIDLRHALGLSRSAAELSLIGELKAPQAAVAGVDELLAEADAQRFDLKVAAAKVDAAEEQIIREGLKAFPDVVIGLDFERPDSKALPGRKILADTARDSIAAGRLTAPAIQSRGQRQIEKSLIVDALLGPGIQLTLPIWDQNQAQIAKARIQTLQARKQREDLLDRVAQQVREAQTTVQISATLVRFYEEEALPQARENVDAARRVLSLGEEDIAGLIQAQDSLIRRQRAYVDALRDHSIALAELERAVGGRVGPAAATQPATPITSAVLSLAR